MVEQTVFGFIYILDSSNSSSSHFSIVSLLLAKLQKVATRMVHQTATQMIIWDTVLLYLKKDIVKDAFLFKVTDIIKKNWNVGKWIV